MRDERVFPGARFRDDYGPIRVIAVCEGYAMCRRPRCVPFVRTVKEVADAMESNAAAEQGGAHD